MKKCDRCGLYDEYPTFIKQFMHWTLLINYMQPTLGSALVVLNRHVSDLSDIKLYEAKDYWDITNLLEKSLKLSFNPQRINHLMLANAVKHVHYHVVPRYSEPREFEGMTFTDEKFGHMPILTKSRLDEKILGSIKAKILENL